MFLDSILSKQERLVIGLSSGTSMDGMDAALVRLKGSGPRTSAEILAFEIVPFADRLRARLSAAACPGGGTTEEVCRLNVEVADVAAQAACAVVRRAGVNLEEVDFVGSHGQTICHLPDEQPASTLQIGEGAVIAERTGLTTVSNFRARDVAAGGQGAPLVPYVDWLLFRSDVENRAMLNLGGIANVTLMPKARDLESIIAFDSGPGNMVVDGVAQALSGGRVLFDGQGQLAGEGEVARRILDRCLEHPFFRKPPPKSTGREAFGSAFVQDVMAAARSSNVSDKDLMATVTELTARTVSQAILLHSAPEFPTERVIAGGGGVHNRTLMTRLSHLLAPIPVVPVEELGVPSDAKEALAFAVLANETVSGIAANVPGATGAWRRVILGQITPGRMQ